MPFEKREVDFFVCPVCGSGYPLEDDIQQRLEFFCRRHACDGKEVFDPSGVGDREFRGPDVPARPAPALTVSSAILINLGLVAALVVVFYLLPILLKSCEN